MKTDVSRQAAATLAAVNRELRRAEDLHWTDPGFLEWERDQVDPLMGADYYDSDVGETLAHWRCEPGPSSRGFGARSRDMFELVADGGGPEWRTYAHDYPPPGQTTHGPLLLGPEPAVVGGLCPDCVGTGESTLPQWGDPAPCGTCDGSGRQRTRGAAANEPEGGAR